MLKVKFRYHTAFDVDCGPDEEVVTFKTVEELEKLLNTFPTLMLRDDTIYKRFPDGNVPVGKILQDQRGHLSELTAD